ncbi:MAG: glycine--tRNA ligase [Parcubacteria group bacterium]|nr:glycine--tRNA ligase [Parcubacteria group bacterium]
MSDTSNKMEQVISWARRRGFIFQSSEIYGGVNAAYDYGPLGVLLKNNIKSLWQKDIVQKRDDVIGFDAAILMHPKVWEASGHLEVFNDPLVECEKCHKRYRADHVADQKCPECGGAFMAARQFNLMFKTFMGPVEDANALVYLRPETAQGIFVNFDNVLKTSRKKIPFGIAQIGKSFRNEITPSNFIFRTREFEQMELEYFVKPDEADASFQYWRQERMNWYLRYGIKKENIQFKDYGKDELAHYAAACTDIEYHFPFGWSELEGVANRRDFDLKQHSAYSGQELSYFDEETKQKYIPYVIEPSAGADRATLAFLVDAFDVMESRSGKGEDDEIVIRFHPQIAPIKVAILPLVKKDQLVKKAREIYDRLKEKWYVQYDESGSIGRRYRRQDEIGTPWCVTVDFETPEKNTVTVRDRDSMQQEKIDIDSLVGYLEEKLTK